VNLDPIREYLLETSRTAARTADACAEEILGATAAIVEALRGGGKILLCGNGGSAGDAQHLATEFVSTLTVDRRRNAIPAIALTTDSSLITAVANDFGFDGVFARQVEALAEPGDLLVLHSTSGESPNVIRAAQSAKARGVGVVAFLGKGGGQLKELADLAMVIPADDTARIQELHLAIEHVICDLVEGRLKG